MRIGEAAARAGVSRDTLRYYERHGLLPRPARTSSGYQPARRRGCSRRYRTVPPPTVIVASVLVESAPSLAVARTT
jgi:predicted site-specific integrase-resolvase